MERFIHVMVHCVNILPLLLLRTGLDVRVARVNSKRIQNQMSLSLLRIPKNPGIYSFERKILLFRALITKRLQPLQGQVFSPEPCLAS